MNTDPRDPVVQLRPSPFFSPAYPTEEQLEVLTITDGLYALIEAHGGAVVMAMVTEGRRAPDGVRAAVDKYGVDRMVRWTRCMAVIAGEEV